MIQPQQLPVTASGASWRSLMRNSLYLLALLVVAVSPLQAQDSGFAAGLPLRNSTEQVRAAMVAAVDGVSDCADVTEAHLAAITEPHKGK